MISIEKLVQSLGHLHEKPLILPNDSKFTQKTAIDLRKIELEQQLLERNDNVSNSIQNVIDYTMNQDFMKEKKTYKMKGELSDKPQQLQQLKPTSSIVYTENEVMNVPDCLNKVFTHNLEYSLNDLYVYGLKNPNSFFKAIQMLHNPEFILKSNTDKINLALMFKREVAIQIDILYKQFKYHKWNFNKLDMINQLLNETIINYSLIIATIDHIQKNVCIFDINNLKFQYFQFASVGTSSSSSSSFYIIIKDGLTFIPIMNSNGIHSFSKNVLDYITTHFEISSIDHPFKERVIDDLNVEQPSSISSSSPSLPSIIIIKTEDEVIKPSTLITKEKYNETKLTLQKLQDLCKTRGIDIQKEGKTGKMIMKLKKELCDELNSHDF